MYLEQFLFDTAENEPFGKICQYLPNHYSPLAAQDEGLAALLLRKLRSLPDRVEPSRIGLQSHAGRELRNAPSRVLPFLQQAISLTEISSEVGFFHRNLDGI